MIIAVRHFRSRARELPLAEGPLGGPPAHEWPARRKRVRPAVEIRHRRALAGGAARPRLQKLSRPDRPSPPTGCAAPLWASRLANWGFRSLPRHANRIRGLLRLDCLRRMIEIVSLGSLARLSGAAIGLAGCSAPQALDRRPASRSCGGQAAAGWSAFASPANVASQAVPMRGISTGSRRCGSAWRARAAPRVDTHCRLGRHHWDWPTLDRRLRPFESDHTEPRRAGTATFWKKR